MNILRKAVTTLGGVFLAALLITAVAPKAARGLAAALVQVSNTSANPVPTVSADANFSYEAFLCNGDCPNTLPESFSVPSTTTTGVPVKRLVIEDLNASCFGGPGGTALEAVVLNVPPSVDNNGIFAGLAYPFILTNFNGGESFGHAVVRIYVDPLATVSFSGTGSTCNVTLTGYLETK
jgi:hypothetical protein